MLNLERYIVTPYKFNGRDFNGFDCYGLVLLWFRHELGIELIDHQHGAQAHGEFTDTGYFTEKAHEEFAPVADGQWRLHDLILLRSRSLTPNHCGIVLGDRILHALERPGCITSKLALWQGNIAGVYRHKDMK